MSVGECVRNECECCECVRSECERSECLRSECVIGECVRNEFMRSECMRGLLWSMAGVIHNVPCRQRNWPHSSMS